MQCDQMLELISGHIDGVNTPEQEQQLQDHLSSCEACRKILEAFTQIDSGLAQLQSEPPADLAANVMKQIEAEPVKPARRKFFFGPGTAIGAVAAVLALLLGSGVVSLPDLTTSADSALDQSAPENTAMMAMDSTTAQTADAAEPEETEDTTAGVAEETPALLSPNLATPAGEAPSVQKEGTQTEESTGPRLQTSTTVADEAEESIESRHIVCVLYDPDQKEALVANFGLQFEKITWTEGQEGVQAETTVATIQEICQLMEENGVEIQLHFPESGSTLEDFDLEEIAYLVIIS